MSKIEKLVLLILLLIAFTFCCDFAIVIVRKAFMPLGKRDSNIDTEEYMHIKADSIKFAMEKAGYSNLVEYVSSITGAQSIPHFVHREIAHTTLYMEEDFLDAWGQPIMILLTTNSIGEVGVAMHSFGENQKDEKGDGDDIVMWLDAEGRYEMTVFRGKARIEGYEGRRCVSILENGEPLFTIDFLGTQQ